MSQTIEARFGREGDSGRQLYCRINATSNRVTWEEQPEGERGFSRAFSTMPEAETFMTRTARNLGYSEKVNLEPTRLNWRMRVVEMLQRVMRFTNVRR